MRFNIGDKVRFNWTEWNSRTAGTALSPVLCKSSCSHYYANRRKIKINEVLTVVRIFSSRRRSKN